MGSTRIETFVSSSFSSRSLMLREVTQRPSRPAKGEVLTEKTIEIVGSSMCSGGSGAGVCGRGDGLADLDALEAGEGHDLAAGGLVRLDPLEAVEDVELRDARRLEPPVALRRPPRCRPTRTRPEKTRPMASRPR